MPKQTDYIDNLTESYNFVRNPTQAAVMSAYMKNLFPFFGIPSPLRKEIFKTHLAKNGLPDYRQLFAIIKNCYEQPEREYHYFAIELAGKFAKNADEDFVPIIEYLITKNSWWDSVDSVASNCTRHFFMRNVSLQIPVTGKWMNSGNMWLQRASILFQLNYRQQTNEQLLFNYILELQHSKEFFIQKAIGWALREYAKHNRKAVEQFIEKATLMPLSIREAQKHF